MTALIDFISVNPPVYDWLLQLEETWPSVYKTTDGTFTASALCSLHVFCN